MSPSKFSNPAQQKILVEVVNDFEGLDSDDPVEKDATEVELEKLVFGDDSAFHHGLKSYKDANGEFQRLEGGERQKFRSCLGEENLKDLDDADLFFLDSAPSAVNVPGLLPPLATDQDPALSENGHSAVWVDSDDERMVVSLASNPRMRKLRVTESEDLVNGKEYSKRLRSQFERLYPVPNWANSSTTRKVAPKKRRKLSAGSESSEANASPDDMSVGNDDMSVQPLAKLLQNINNQVQIKNNPTRRKKLRPELIDIHRTKDVSTTQLSAVTSLAFHPVHSLLLSSGPASTLFLHHISPHPPNANPLLTSLHLGSTPLTTSLFCPPVGNKIFLSGRRRYFHVWYLDTGKVEKVSRVIGHDKVQRSMERFKLSPCGRWVGFVGSVRKDGGTISVLDANTCQWIAEVRVEGKGGVADFEWWSDGEGLMLVGKGGEVVEWDGRERRVIARWIDEGAVGTTVTALGGGGCGSKTLGNDRWVAIGSTSGIVNIYDRRKWSPESIPARPKPVRAFGQLTTPISHLEFSPNGQLLCMTSRWRRDAFRLIHLPSCTVYRNWPTISTPLGTITAVAWSPTSEMIAVANEQGKIRLWEIRS